MACQAVAPLCSQTTLVNITDREGDLYDLFVQALKVSDESRVELLVRALVRAHHGILGSDLLARVPGPFPL